MWILLIAVLMTEAQSEVIKTSCENVDVHEGDKATLIFRFSENISQHHRSVRVKHYTSFREENVLTCHWLNTKECDVRPTYTFDGMISNELRIVIPDFTENHVGRYLCFVLPAEPGSYQMCNVSLKADKQQGPLKIPTNAPTSERNFSILPKDTSYDVLKRYPLLPAVAILGGILLIVCVLVIIAARRYYNFSMPVLHEYEDVADAENAMPGADNSSARSRNRVVSLPAKISIVNLETGVPENYLDVVIANNTI